MIPIHFFCLFVEFSITLLTNHIHHTPIFTHHTPIITHHTSLIHTLITNRITIDLNHITISIASRSQSHHNLNHITISITSQSRFQIGIINNKISLTIQHKSPYPPSAGTLFTKYVNCVFQKRLYNQSRPGHIRYTMFCVCAST